MRWPEVALGEVLRTTTRRERVNASTEYRLLGVRLEGAGAFLRETRLGAQLSASTLSRVQAGDFIYSRLFAWRGAFAVVPAELDGCFVSNEFPTFRPTSDSIDVHYLSLWFKLPHVLVRVAADCTGSTPLTRNRFKEQFFLGLEIPLPPIDEQRRVVRRIEHLATRLEDATRLQVRVAAEAAVLHRAVYAAAERSATLSGESRALRDMIRTHDSGWSPQCDEWPATAGSWGVLKTTCVQWAGFEPEANKALRAGLAPRGELTVRTGDVLVTRAGPVNRVGVACVVPSDQTTLMLSDKIVRLVADDDVVPDYLALILGAPAAQEHFRQSKTGLAASQVNISRQRLLALQLAFPSKRRQAEIVSNARRSLAMFHRFEKQREASVQLREATNASLLRRAFGTC